MENRNRIPVAVSPCRSYDPELIYKLMKAQLEGLGITREVAEGKRVALKPNLVRKMDCSLAGTTHPAFIEAAGRLFNEWGASDIVVAESPGGAYNETALRNTYRVCGIEEAAARAGVRLNYEIKWERRDFPEGMASKSFNIIKPLLDADITVNLCKLKTHGMTMMSAAVKNLFGSVPGVEKFEMHARFPDIKDFTEMIIDLCAMHHASGRVISLVDAVVGMEGNGPTNGTPRKIGALLSSENAFALDYVCAELIGFERKVPMVARAAERGFYSPDMIEIRGVESLDGLKVADFRAPDSERLPILTWLAGFGDGRIMKLFEPKPYINTGKCVACGECVRSCPKHTIGINRKKHTAVINHGSCIKCFCCQELCPSDAVIIKQNPLIRLIH